MENTLEGREQLQRRGKTGGYKDYKMMKKREAAAKMGAEQPDVYTYI